MISSVNMSQANAIDNKAMNWVNYLNSLSGDIHTKGLDSFYQLRAASLWASTFAYIEWLVSFYQGSTFPNIDTVTGVLNSSWGWDKELCKLFWKSGRHPFAHVGQTNSFYSYYKYKGLETNVSFDVNKWSTAVVDEWDDHHKYIGVAIAPPLSVEGSDLQIIYFHHQMMRDDLLLRLASFVSNYIRDINNEDELKNIVRLNMQIPG